MLGHHSHMLHGPALVGDGQRARRQLRRIQPAHIGAVSVGIDDHPTRKRPKGRVRAGPGVHRQIGADAGFARSHRHGIDRRVAAVISGVALRVVGHIVQIAAGQGRHGTHLTRGRVVEGELRHGHIHVLRPRSGLYHRQILAIFVGAQRTQRVIGPAPGNQLAGIQRVALHDIAGFSLAVVLRQPHHFAILHEHGADIATVIAVVCGARFLRRLQRAQRLGRRAARGVHQERDLAAALVVAIEAFAVGHQALNHRHGVIRVLIAVANQALQHGFRSAHSGGPALQLHLSFVLATVQAAHQQVEAFAHHLPGADDRGIGVAIISYHMQVDIHALGQR